jgi:S-adenosylmethionine:tRNA ribosyltransferase-isomerase
LDVRDFDFELPSDLIAQEPSRERGASRLLLLSRATGVCSHSTIGALPSLLEPGDLLVVNNTRVVPARLLGHRVPTGGAVECLLIGHIAGDRWEALMHPGQKLAPGAMVVFEGATTLRAEVLERRFHGRRLIRLWTDNGTSVNDAVDRIGHVPLPPYIKRGDRASDRDRYQTIFAGPRGAVAAPTAGLHFSPAIVDECRARGIELIEITLHIGYGTFQPVRVTQVEDHRVEPEHYEISEGAAVTINRALTQRRRIIAVGTTTTRTMETVAHANQGEIAAGAGLADLFIYPGFAFRVVTGLLTNFHLPRSSLVMLVSAFAGRERLFGAYREAIANRYRFYSYGDAMLIL